MIKKMKKLAVLGMGVCVALAFSSCKSNESAYKKAYENAKKQELAEAPQPTETATVEESPVVSAPVEAPKVVESTQVGVRQEKVTVVSGTGLKDYNVVAGSFSVKANAENLKAFLDKEGYSASVAFNADNSMYRVIVAKYHDRDSAAAARDAFKAKYPNRNDFQGAWLLYRIN